MKKTLIALFTCALALAACNKEEEKVEIPSIINATFTAVQNNGVTAGTPNKLAVAAQENGAEISIVFSSEKIYLEDGAYTVGSANGNFTAHYKDQYVDNDVVSGTLTVSSDSDSKYTISGTLKLNNPEATLVKVSASGVMEYELPAEYCYIKTTDGSAIVYSIYSLGEQNNLLAMATVYGNETGEFEVNTSAKSGSAMVGTNAKAGTFISVDNWGYFMQLSGSVKIMKKAGKLNFSFDGVYDGSYNNCEEVKSVNVPAYKTPTDGMFVYKYFFAPSPIINGAFECTAKVFTSDGVEFASHTIIVSSQEFYLGENQGKGLGFYNKEMADYNKDVEAANTNFAIKNAGYYSIDGVKYAIPDGYVFVINDNSITKGYSMLADIDGSYSTFEPLLTFLGGSIWTFICFPYPTN